MLFRSKIAAPDLERKLGETPISSSTSRQRSRCNQTQSNSSSLTGGTRFNKGTKRVNRLRFLAHEGLMAQHWMTVPGRPAAPAAVVPRETVEANVNPGSARHTNHAFDAPPVGVEV